MGVWKIKVIWSYGFKGGIFFLWVFGEVINIIIGVIFI